MTTDTMFYIQDTRQPVGNCVLWWRPDGLGYTTEIDEAGLYTKERADSIHRNRSTDVPWPEWAVKKATVQHVRLDRLRQITKPMTAKRKPNEE